MSGVSVVEGSLLKCGLFTALQDHAHELRSCLNTVQANPGRAAPKVRLAELVFEGLRLRAYHPIGNGSSGPFGATWLPVSTDAQSTAHLKVSCLFNYYTRLT